MRKKRYHSVTQIKTAIDKAKVRFEKKLATAIVHELAGRPIDAKKRRIEARRIKDNQLDILKQKLSEFCTELLPGVITDGDRSIPASSRKPKPTSHQ
jgi:hypothetical protein